MAITGITADARVFKALGGDPEGRTKIELANDAGHLLMSMRPWRWADGAETLLNLTASQGFVWLPTDFRDLKAAQLAGETATWLYPTTHVELLEMRARDLVTADTPAFYVVVHASNAGVYQPRLEIHPTPTTTAANAVRFWYTKGWAPFPDPADATAALMPTWMEMLYMAVLGAVARAWEDDLESPSIASAYLDPIIRGWPYLTAIKRDGEMQPNVGGMVGGFASDARSWGPYIPPVTL
jgi:hypothetical protein